MKKKHLKLFLQREVDKYRAKIYEELLLLEDPLTYECDTEHGWYQAEVQIVEKGKDFVKVAVSIDDGGLRSFFPLSAQFTMYQNGRIK